MYWKPYKVDILTQAVRERVVLTTKKSVSTIEINSITNAAEKYLSADQFGSLPTVGDAVDTVDMSTPVRQLPGRKSADNLTGLLKGAFANDLSASKGSDDVLDAEQLKKEMFNKLVGQLDQEKVMELVSEVLMSTMAGKDRDGTGNGRGSKAPDFKAELLSDSEEPDLELWENRTRKYWAANSGRYDVGELVLQVESSVKTRGAAALVAKATHLSAEEVIETVNEHFWPLFEAKVMTCVAKFLNFELPDDRSAKSLSTSLDDFEGNMKSIAHLTFEQLSGYMAMSKLSKEERRSVLPMLKGDFQFRTVRKSIMSIADNLFGENARETAAAVTHPKKSNKKLSQMTDVERAEHMATIQCKVCQLYGHFGFQCDKQKSSRNSDRREHKDSRRSGRRYSENRNYSRRSRADSSVSVVCEPVGKSRRGKQNSKKEKSTSSKRQVSPSRSPSRSPARRRQINLLDAGSSDFDSEADGESESDL